MNEKQPPAKDLRTTKKMLRQELDMDFKELQKYLNPIIAENRKMPLDKAKMVHKVRHTEVLKLYAKIGEDINEMARINA